MAYLSGDTGAFADMKTTVNEFYGAELAVINIGGIFTMGPEEAADAINRLIKPKAAIASHANEVGTVNGVVAANTRTARFLELLKGVAGYVPLSGRVIEFDGEGNCAAGCPEIPVTSVTLTPSTVTAGGSFTATFSGTGLDSKTYFDVRFRTPGSSSEDVAYNWQQGTSALHTLPAGVASGTYTITGVRAHRNKDDHSGTFTAVTATLVVTGL